MKKLLTLFLALVMIFSLAVPALAAEYPQGANHKVVEITDGMNPGTYLVNDTWDTYTASNQANKGYAPNRLVASDYSWDPAWETDPAYGNFNGTGGYVFNPDDYPDLVFHEDGYPIRATYRTPIEYLGEMRYLAETYPDITRLVYLGRTNGVSKTSNTDYYNVYPEYSIPLYALEISSAPGVMDGRPATLHQAGNHAGEIDANEFCGNLMWYLVTQYGENDEVTDLIDTTRIYLLPYTNGDGNTISHRSASGNRRLNARGVDLNRNWAYRWGSTNGADNNPGQTMHRGSSPNSEPETTAISSIYRTDNVLSSISGHTSGQIVIFAWAFVENPKNGHPLLHNLAVDQTDINGYTAQNGNVMYAQSGEINDYLWGSMRALGFTYEYMTAQVNPYLGTDAGPNITNASLRGQPYMIGNFPSPLGTDTTTMRAGDYRGGTAVVNNSTPINDLTAQLAFLEPEEFHAGYQSLAAGVGTNVLPAPGLRMLTPAMLEAELIARPGFVNGKIFMSHVASNTANATAIVDILNREGAKGWIVVNTANSLRNGNYGHYNPPVAYGPSDSNLIVTSVTKGYAANIYAQYQADPTTTVTFKADRANLLSVESNWQRNKPAFMRNMKIAREYANQVKGTVQDENGNDLDATLEASLVIEGKIVALTSNVGTNGTIERPYEEQWKEVQRVRYEINEDTTENGEYTWFMLPSKQTEYDDKGWTITASAPGRYTQTRNLKFATDGADPLYKQVVEGIDFTLPKAVDATLAGDKVEFTTYAKNGTAADQLGVYVLVNGVSVEVVSLGNGKYEATAPASYEYISVGFTGAAPVVFGEIPEPEGTLVDSTTAVADLELTTTNKKLLKAGDYFNVNTAFVKAVPTNVVKLTYNFNPELFEYRGNKFAEAGLTVLNVAQDNGKVEFTLMKQDGSYGFKELYWYDAKLVETDLGLVNQVETDYSVLFSAKEDVAFENGFENITAVASYVVEEDGNKVMKTSNIAMVTLTTTQDGPDVIFDLIFLSNIIDAYGFSIGHSEWYTKYIFWDYNGSGTIDIGDIVYVAQKIQ